VVIDLGEVRRMARRTQVELADSLGTNQGKISRLEGRRGMLLSTLGAYLTALGVDAKIVVEIGEQTVTYELTAGRGKR
jgi:hypothetical protein